MKAKLLYEALQLNKSHFKPMDIWDKISYASQMLYCEQAIESGKYKNLPENIVFHVENDGACMVSDITATVTA